MSEAIVGHVGVEVFPVVPDFARRLREKLLPDADKVGTEAGRVLSDRLRSAMGDAKVKVDTTQAKAEVDSIGARLQALGRGAGIKLKVDTSEVATKIAAIKAALEQKLRVDTGEFDAKIAAVKAKLAEIQNKKLSVAVDTANANAKLLALDAEARKLQEALKSKAEIDTGAAQARLAEIAGEIQGIRDAKAHVRVDTAEASAKTAELKAKLEELTHDRRIKVDADTAEARAKIDELKASARDVKAKGGASDAGSGAGGIGAMVGAALALGPALIPIAGAAIPLIAGIGAAAVGAGAGIGVLALAFHGIGGAVSALGAQSSQTGQQLKAQAAQQLSSANAVLNAQDAVRSSVRALANAQTQAGQQAISSAESVKNAEQSLADARRAAAASVRNSLAQVASAEQSYNDARRSAAASVLSAEQGVSSSVQSLADARRAAAASVLSAEQGVTSSIQSLADTRRSAAMSVVSAEQGVVTAEQSLSSAQYTEQQAQINLTLARKQASQTLQDLSNSVKDGALTQRQATLDLQNAQTALVVTDFNPHSTTMQREQAQLAVDQAKQHLSEVELANTRTAQQKAAADKLGVSNAPAVLAAENAMGNATQSRVNAQQALIRSQAAVREAERAGAESVGKAQQALVKSEVALTEARRAGAESVGKAQQALVKSEVALTEARRAGAESVGNAERSLVQAQAASVEARRAGAESVAKAEQGVTDALRNQAQQAVASQQAILSAQQAITASRRALGQAHAAAGAQGNTAANAVATAMAGLSPAGRAFAMFVNGTLRPAFKTLTDGAQTGFLPGFQKALQTLMPYMPMFAVFVGKVAKVLGDMAQSAAKALTSPFWKQFFTFLGDTALKALPVLGTVIGNLATGFAGLFQALAPAAGGMGGGLTTITKAFADWATHLGTNKGFQHFLQYIKDNAPKVGHALLDVADAVGKLIKGLAQGGGGELTLIGKALGFISRLSPGQITAIVTAFAGFKIVKDLAGPVKDLGKAFKFFTDNPILLALTLIVGGLIYAYTHFKTFRDVVNRVWKDLQIAAEFMWIAVLKPMFKWIGEHWHFVTTAMRFAWDSILRPTFSAIGTAIGFLWNNVSKPIFSWVSAHWSDMTTGMRWAWNNILSPMLNTIGGAIGFLWTNVSKPIFSWVSKHWSDMTTGMKWVWDNLLHPIFSKAMPNAFNSVSKAFGAFRDGLSAVWTDIKNIFTGGLDFIVRNVLNKLIDGINKVTNLFGIPAIPDLPVAAGPRTVPRTDGTAGSSGGTARHAFAHGGVLPGYAPGQDIIHAMLSPGEGVLVPEAVRGLGGPGFIHALNRRFSNRAPSSDGQHFAGGGVPGWAKAAAGDVFSALNPLASVAGHLFGGAAENAALNLAEAPIKAVLSHLSPQIIKTLGTGAFGLIDKAVRAYMGSHHAPSASGATVTGPNSGTSLDYAKIIIQQAKSMNLGAKGAEIGLMTALVESGLKNYANANIPESLRLPHDAVGSDHYSAGLFQQQTGPFGNYWGTVPQVMNPAYTAHRFFDELLRKVPGYQGIDSGVAAQTVQVSAFPDAYSARRGDADALLSQLKYDQGGYLPPGLTQVYNGTGRPEPVFTDQQWNTLASNKGTASGSGKIADTINFHEAMDPQQAASEIFRRQQMASNV